MAELISSGTNLSSNYFLQNFYRMNRNVIKASTRSDYSATELSYEDTRALKRAVSQLESFEYEESENGANIANTIKAFAETYNNVIDSTSGKSSDNYRLNRQLKELTKKYGDDLEDIGITIEEDGKLSISDNLLKKSSFKNIRKVFSDDSDFVSGVKKIARRMNNTSYEAVYEQMTGAGGKINIVL